MKTLNPIHAKRFLNADAGGGSGGGSGDPGAAGGAPAGGGQPNAGGTLFAGSSPAAGSSQQPPASQSAPPSQSSQPWIQEDGSFAPNWIERLPEDIRGEASLRVVPSVADLAKSYVATKKLVGTKLEAPGENATPEQIANWRKTVGAPETPEGYIPEGAKTLRPDSIPENLWNTEAEKGFLALAHKHHLPPAAVKEILEYHAQNVGAALTQSQAQEGEVLKAEGAKLRQAWGTEYDTNLALAARVAQTVGLDPNTNPIFTNADAVLAFAKMGKFLTEDKLVKGNANGIAASITDKIREITDTKSQSVIAREYRGEFGPDRQAAAQRQLHELYAAQTAQ